MDFLPYTLKWLELVLRWAHVLFAILWVGNSFLFNYLDNKLNKDISSEDVDGEGYLMHSGSVSYTHLTLPTICSV